MIRALIFDFDGVILESVDGKGQAFREVFARYPQHTNAILKYHYANGGVPRFDKFRYIYREILKQPLTEAEFQRLCEDFSRIARDAVMQASFVAGAKEFFEANRGRFLMFVVSGTPHEEIRECVAARGLKNYFQDAFGSPTDKGVWTKKILADNRFAPQEALWIGDALSDWEAARQNNIGFVARIYPHADVFGNRPLFRKIPDLRILDSVIKDFEYCKGIA